MWTRPLLCSLLLPAAFAETCEGEPCRAPEGDDAAGLVQLLRTRRLERQRAAPARASDGGCWLLGEVPPPQDGASYQLDLADAEACINMIEGPAWKAKGTVLAAANYFKSFYAFAYIATDPPAGNYTFAPMFSDLGIFGGENGGAPANLSKVDLIGDWEAIAGSIPENDTVPVQSWVGPMNNAFIKLRDCHPTLWYVDANTFFPPVLALRNIFKVILADLEAGKPVSLLIDSGDNWTIDGAAAPVLKDASGNTVKSIGGEPPLDWLRKNIAESPAHPGQCAKSIGGRMNQMMNIMAKGITYSMGLFGTFDSLTPGNISVELEAPDGASTPSNWAWQVVATLKEGCDFNCTIAGIMDNLSQPGVFYEAVKAPTNALNESWADSGALALPAVSFRREPQLPGSAALSLLDGEPPEVPLDNSSLPQDVFAWLLSPQCTYGYLAFRTRPDGSEFGVFKYDTFDTTHSCEDEEYNEGSEDKIRTAWKEFTSEAESRNVTRLIVDFVGNGGGTTRYAWQFVQMMLPELPYKTTCGSQNRPIPKAYEMWRQINLLPLEQFTSEETGKGFQQDRYNQLVANQTLFEGLVNNTKTILRGIESFEMVNTTAIVDYLEADTSAQTYGDVLSYLQGLYQNGSCVNPFALADTQTAMAYEHPQLEDRGGYSRNFTARVYDCPQHLSDDLTNPFTDIIYASDGTCGSSCYLAGGQSWAIARKYSHRSIRFATFGGVGGGIAEAKKTLNPTAFPGGNIQSRGNLVLNGIFSCLLVQLGLANIIGDPSLEESLADVWNEMTSMVSPYAPTMPGYTQNEVFQPVFGERTPPAEYVFTPTDLYMPAWFYNVSGANAYKWNATQLDEMHQLAAQGFYSFA